MIHIKEYIAKQFINKSFHFKCDCLIPLDITGTVKDYKIAGSDIILIVDTTNKLIRVCLNTPSLQVEPI